MPDAPSNSSVCAVVVTCHPQAELLKELLASVSPQVGAVLVVDNGSPPELLATLSEHPAGEPIELLELGDNIGLGAAHNLGIAWARRRGFSFVLLLDHDSIPAADMVSNLLAGYREASRRDRVAAVGPAYQDPRTGKFGPFVRFGIFWNSHIPSRTDCQSVPQENGQSVSRPPGGNGPLRTDFLITSGTLIPLAVTDGVGGMDEGLFVDYVDTEWSLRAASQGFRLYGIPDAVMTHTIGDRVRQFAMFHIHEYSPLRLYYNIRNRFLLSRKPFMPSSRKIRNVLHAIRLFLVYGLLIGPRRRNLQMLCRGLRDACAGRDGRYDFARRPKSWSSLLDQVRRDQDETPRRAA